MARIQNTSIRLTEDGRAIQEALQVHWEREFGRVTLSQVLERALRIAAREEGLDMAQITAPIEQAKAEPAAK